MPLLPAPVMQSLMLAIPSRLANHPSTLVTYSQAMASPATTISVCEHESDETTERVSMSFSQLMFQSPARRHPHDARRVKQHQSSRVAWNSRRAAIDRHQARSRWLMLAASCVTSHPTSSAWAATMRAQDGSGGVAAIGAIKIEEEAMFPLPGEKPRSSLVVETANQTPQNSPREPLVASCLYCGRAR